MNKISISQQWELTKYFQSLGILTHPENKTSLLSNKRLRILVRDYVKDFSYHKFAGNLSRAHAYLVSRGKIENFYQGKGKSIRKSSKKDLFYCSPEWRRVRYEAIKAYKRKCMCCGRNPDDHGIVLHVDHIKPRSTHPSLELEVSNLQILCEDCNLGKSNRDSIDYRPKLKLIKS